MQWRNTSSRYGLISKIFHWSVAISIIAMLIFGVYMEDLPKSIDKIRYYGWHKSIGAILLATIIARIIWKIASHSPTLPHHMSRNQQRLAHLSHGLLYGLMLYMPLTGWFMSSSAGFTVSVFGWFTLPNLVPVSKENSSLFNQLHEIGLWAFGIMIGLHIAASLVHHFYYKDDILARMTSLKKHKF